MMQFAQEFPQLEIVSRAATQLSWSHIVEILPLRDGVQREFYLADAIPGRPPYQFARKLVGRALRARRKRFGRALASVRRRYDKLQPVAPKVAGLWYTIPRNREGVSNEYSIRSAPCSRTGC